MPRRLRRAEGHDRRALCGGDAARRLAYVVDEDSLGFTRLFADYGFTITLASAAAERTTVGMDTYYTPRNAVVVGLKALMRRRFAKTVDGLLHGLRALAEERALSADLEKRTPRSDLHR